MKKRRTYNSLVLLNRLFASLLFISVLYAAVVPEQYIMKIPVEIEMNMSDENQIETKESEVDNFISHSGLTDGTLIPRGIDFNEKACTYQDLHVSICTPPPEG
ncbi:MAG TPA: hypothetical protein DCX54_13060 [Flavobacteriales bacterium]|nr:hypothetical protein [Flavobacteriales bacterium]